ncbi:phage holin [Mammaliicoccus sciuri]|uniref:phage holin n=1 Tax=Mammaliicoccus sciuri TaxID=1296 RepID=UPI002DB5E421|nr:phage holin [Mammaliicoccus sciuri]MEB8129743.1 phage holin [Mammaliicoccus sciuri]
MKNIDAGTLTRIIVLVIALINQALALTGFNPIPVDEDALYQFISMAFMGVASIWAWWKNNPVTKEAKWGQEKTNKYKAQKKMAKATGGSQTTILHDENNKNI